MYAITVLYGENRVVIEDADNGQAVLAGTREDVLEFVTMKSANKFIADNIFGHEMPEVVETETLKEENFAAIVE